MQLLTDKPIATCWSTTALKNQIGPNSVTVCSSLKDNIISDFEAGRSKETKRKHNFDDVNELLLKWFPYARDEKIPVNDEMLLLKAQ